MDYRYRCDIPAEHGRNALPFNPCTLLDLSFLRLDVGRRVRRVRRSRDPGLWRQSNP